MTRAPGPETLRLDEIVLAAAALDPPERSAYLDRLTAEHPDVVARARHLLHAAVEVSDSFLVRPAIDGLETEAWRVPELAPTVDPEAEGDALAAPPPNRPEDRYTLGPRLGEGGMAEVFRAHDHQLDRPVALKRLTGDDPAALARCVREARAQARVRHPHVLEVYDTGEFDGRPFLAVRLVEGSTLLELAEQVSLEQQVALLIQVAEGLDAAHRQGLVHRDVKPSNVLVEADDDGALHAWVSDFGIAAPVRIEAATGDESPRTPRRLVGTLAYLAPERLDLAAPPDRRGDVWSLGVLMYRSFTGELPFEGRDPPELLRAIRSQKPRPPRELAPLLPRDLEAIVMRCLSKDHDTRYATARDVAVDLRRFLDGEVVEAHAAGLAYRVSRFALRHQRWLRVVAGVSVLLLASLVAAAWLGWRALDSERRAVARQGQAEELIGFLLVDLRAKLDRLGRLELIDDVSDEAMLYFASVRPDDLSDGELARWSTALHQLGEVSTRRGELAGALEAFEQSLALARASHERDPRNLERLFDLGQSQFWVGSGHRQLGDFRRAREAFTSYLDTSRRLVKDDPANARWRLELGYAHANLGTLLRDLGELDPARERFQASFEEIQTLAASSPEDLDLQSELAWAHNSLGDVLAALGDTASARRHFEEELALRKALVGARPDDATWRNDLAVSHNFLGHALTQEGDWEAAVSPFEAALAIHRGLVAGDPENQARRLRLAIVQNAIGRARLALGDRVRATDALRAAQEWLESTIRDGEVQVSGHHRRELAWARLHLARIAWPEDLDTTEAQLEAAESGLEALLAEVPADRVARGRLAIARALRGEIARATGDDDAARAAWRSAADRLEALDKSAPDSHLDEWRDLLQRRLGGSDPEPETAPARIDGCDPLRIDPCGIDLSGSDSRGIDPSDSDPSRAE